MNIALLHASPRACGQAAVDLYLPDYPACGWGAVHTCSRVGVVCAHDTDMTVVHVVQQGPCCDMQGAKEAVVLALHIMCDAVDRYKELCEGQYSGELAWLLCMLTCETYCGVSL